MDITPLPVVVVDTGLWCGGEGGERGGKLFLACTVHSSYNFYPYPFIHGETCYSVCMDIFSTL